MRYLICFEAGKAGSGDKWRKPIDRQGLLAFLIMHSVSHSPADYGATFKGCEDALKQYELYMEREDKSRIRVQLTSGSFTSVSFLIIR